MVAFGVSASKADQAAPVLADAYGRETPEGALIDMTLPQHVIGNLIGTSRVSVNQHMGAWKQRGLIKTQRSRVILKDPEQLELIADGADD